MSQDSASKIGDIERLGKLLDEGRIIQEEYELLKNEVLDSSRLSASGTDAAPSAGSLLPHAPDSSESSDDLALVSSRLRQLADTSTTTSFDALSTLTYFLLWAAAAYWAVQAGMGLSLVSDSFAQGIWGNDGVPDWVFTMENWYPLTLITTAGAFVAWSYRAHANLRLLERAGIKHKDHETIWWWVVPIANLFKPYLVVHETARGTSSSLGDPAWNSQAFPRVVHIWTWTFVGGLVVSMTAGGMLNSAWTIDAIRTAGGVGALGAVSLVVAAGAGSSMVRQISAGQRFLARRLLRGRGEAIATAEEELMNQRLASGKDVWLG